jgi:hypothetical protein
MRIKNIAGRVREAAESFFPSYYLANMCVNGKIVFLLLFGESLGGLLLNVRC